MPRIEGLNHITLTVNDVERSREWYESVLGFRTLNVLEIGGYRMVVLGEPRSGTVIALNGQGGTPADRFDETRTGLDHVSFAVRDTDELRSWRAHFEQLGVPHSPMAEDPFGLVLVFRDPDNIQLELFAPARPGATTGGAVLQPPPG
jgi:catechol 2,3-dioxygenase-like lactoylglutathione lyase family enzyme